MIPPTNNFKLHVFFWKPIFTTQRYFEPISPSLTFFPQLNVVGILNSAHECNRPSLLDFLFSDPPLPAAIVVVIVSCMIPPTNNFKLHVFFWKPIFTTQRYFEPISPSLTFFPQLNVVGILNSAHECNRPSLLDFLFSDPPLPAAIVVVIVIVWSRPLTISNCTYFSENRFSLHNDISNPSRPA